MPTLDVVINAAKAKTGAREFVTAVDHMQRETRETARETDKLDRSMTGLGSTAGMLKGKLLGLFGGVGAGLILRSAVSSIAQFEQTMLTLRGVTGATDEELQRFSDTARGLGATTRFTAAQAGDALLTLAKAGLNVDQSIAAVTPTLNIAATEMISLEESADIVVATLGQFGLAASDASRIADVLVVSSNAATTSAAELGQSLKFAGAFANAMGIDLETASAALAVLSNNAIRGALGGTALRGVISHLAKPTAEARVELKRMADQLGTTVDVFDVQANGLIDVLDALNRAGASADPNTILKVFGVEVTPGALALVSQVDTIKQVLELNKEATGSSQKLADTINTSLLASMASFQSAVEAAYLEAGDAGLLGVLKDTVGVATNVVRAFSGAAAVQEEYARATGAAVFAVEALGAASVSYLALNMVGATYKLVTAIRAATTAQATFNAVLARSGIGLIAIGVGTLAAALIDFTPEVEGAADAFGEFNEEMERFKGLAEQTVEAEKMLAQAQLNASTEDRLTAIQRRIAVLQEAQRALLDDAGKPVRISWLEYLEGIVRSPEVIGAARAEAEAELKQYKEMLASAAPDPTDWLESFTFIADGGERFRDTLNELSVLASAYDFPIVDPIRFVNAELARLQDELRSTQTELDAMAEATKPPSEALQEFIDALSAELETAKLSENQRERHAIARKAEALAMKEGARSTLGYVAAVMRLVDAIDAERAAEERRKRAQQGKDELEAIIVNMQFERSLIGLTNDEREVEIARREASAIAMEKQVDRGQSLVATIVRLKREMLALVAAEEERARKQRDQTDAADALKDMFDALEEERRLIGLTNDERERAEALIRAESLAQRAYADDVNRTTAEIDRYRNTLYELQTLRIEDSIKRQDDALKAEIATLGKSRVEREHAAEIAERQIALERAYGKESEKTRDGLEAYIATLSELDRARELAQLADDIGDAFADSFTDVVFGAQSASEAIEGLARSVTRMVFEQVVAQQIASMLSTTLRGFMFPSAKGNVFMGGSVVPFAQGGVVTQPTAFPMNDGRVGLMGEEGAEAIMPLARNERGQLGVRANGSQGGGNNFHVSMKVYAADADSFNRSQSQTMRKAARQARRTMG